MLMVETYLSTSSIQGIGLFASNNISKGTVIWKYDKRTTISWSTEEWELIKQTTPSIAFKNMERFAYLHHNQWLLNLDDSRFMNHSNNPNMGYDQDLETCYALCDIPKGEELTIRYGDFCEAEDPDYYL